MFTSSPSIFRSLLIASAGAILLTGASALADPPQGRGRDNDGNRGRGGYDHHDTRDNRGGRDWNRNDSRGRDWGRNNHYRSSSRVVVNFNSLPYYYAPRPAYYRPVVIYRSYPNYYPAYSPYRTILATPAAYEVFEYTQPATPVTLDQGYTLTPGEVTDAGDGRYCREYQAKVVINNQLQDSYGQACRQPDGSWEIVS